MSFPRNYTFMGRRGCVVGEVQFDDCRVSAESLLGKINGGFRIMLEMFNFERILCPKGGGRSGCSAPPEKKEEAGRWRVIHAAQ